MYLPAFVGRNLWIGLRICCLHLVRHKASQGQEGLRHWHGGNGGRTPRRRYLVHWWNSCVCSRGTIESYVSSHFRCKDPEDCTFEPLSLTEFKPDPSVGAVICGLDTHMTYRKLSKAFQYLTRNPGCHFLASNEDSTYPVAGGRLLGAGAISAPLRFALGKDPISIGKPATTMLDCIKAK